MVSEQEHAQAEFPRNPGRWNCGEQGLVVYDAVRLGMVFFRRIFLAAVILVSVACTNTVGDFVGFWRGEGNLFGIAMVKQDQKICNKYQYQLAKEMCRKNFAQMQRARKNRINSLVILEKYL